MGAIMQSRKSKLGSIDRRAALKGGLAILGLPTMATVITACGGRPKQGTSPYSELIADLSELIIPETDTPGAKSAGVPAYAEAVVETFMTDEERTAFNAGMQVFDTLAHAREQMSFVQSDAETKQEILQLLEQGTEEVDNSAWRDLREIVIFGYYTSEAATEELAYEQIPGRQVGCVPYEEIGRAWLDRGV